MVQMSLLSFHLKQANIPDLRGLTWKLA